MANHGRAGLVWFALATVVFLLMAGCNGFFTNPTVTQISVTPAIASISPCSAPVPGLPCTVQLTATGTFSDGSTGPVTVTWTSSSTAVATVNTGGTVSGVAPGSATVSASSGAITPGTSSIQVCGVSTTSIVITGPASATLTTPPSSVVYTAKDSNGADITTQVVWQTSNASVATIGATTGVITAISMTGSTNISATACGVTSNTITLTVT